MWTRRINMYFYQFINIFLINAIRTLIYCNNTPAWAGKSCLLESKYRQEYVQEKDVTHILAAGLYYEILSILKIWSILD